MGHELEMLRSGVTAFPPGVYEFLQVNIHRFASVFEWGPGSSTFFFLKNFGKVVAVDHFPKWYTTMLEALKGYTGCEITMVPPQLAQGERFDPSDISLCQSTTHEYEGFSFREYVAFVDQYPDGHFDLISVDGRARPSCLQHAIPKLKPGGFLLLDDSERTRYDETKKLVVSWECHRFVGRPPNANLVRETSIWRKPQG